MHTNTFLCVRVVYVFELLLVHLNMFRSCTRDWICIIYVVSVCVMLALSEAAPTERLNYQTAYKKISEPEKTTTITKSCYTGGMNVYEINANHSTLAQSQIKHRNKLRTTRDVYVLCNICIHFIRSRNTNKLRAQLARNYTFLVDLGPSHACIWRKRKQWSSHRHK